MIFIPLLQPNFRVFIGVRREIHSVLHKAG
jgi:hypothetical protein